jgi:hypothetical protein
MTTAELTERLSTIGWTYVPKSQTAYFTVKGAGRVYLRLADRRDYSRLAATLRFAPTVHISDFEDMTRDMSYVTHTAKTVTDLLLQHLESNA